MRAIDSTGETVVGRAIMLKKVPNRGGSPLPKGEEITIVQIGSKRYGIRDSAPRARWNLYVEDFRLLDTPIVDE